MVAGAGNGDSPAKVAGAGNINSPAEAARACNSGRPALVSRMANVGKYYFLYKEKFNVTLAEVNSTFGSLLAIKFTLLFIPGSTAFSVLLDRCASCWYHLRIVYRLQGILAGRMVTSPLFGAVGERQM